jgi:glycosyltransferase involved in cell wall biosynthesis
MKILILDQFSEPGGAQLCLRDLAPEFARRQWHATFMAPGDGAVRGSLAELGIKNERLPDLAYNNGRKSFRDVARYGLDIAHVLASIARLAGKNRPDLIYINGPRVLPAGMAFGCPIVFHAHTYLVKTYARMIAVMCLRMKRVEVIASSRFAGRALDGLIAADRMRILYSGVPDMGFVAERREAEILRIGIIGRIAPEKGQLDAIRAAKFLLASGHRVELAIYGASMFSTTDYEARVRYEAAGIPVRFAGWTEDVAKALHEIDVLAVPSGSIEAAGRVIMEALSAGTTVVAYPSGGIPELIRDRHTGLLTEQPTPASLARSIETLLADPALRLRIANEGRREWESRFQMGRFQREVCDLFESLVAERGIGRVSAPVHACASLSSSGKDSTRA